MTYERYQHGIPTNGSSASPRQIQSDLAEIRQEMDRTLADISARLEPKELLSSLMHSFAGGSAGRFVSNLSRSFENPIPVALIASGFGYLIYDDAQRRKHELALEGDGKEAASSAAGAASDKAQGALSSAKHAGSQVSRRARDAAGSAGQAARHMAQRGQQLLHEQPLVVAGLGLALGAAMAGTAPVSRQERELMGGPAGEAVGRLGEAAKSKAQQAGHAVAAAGRAAKQELGHGGAAQQQPTAAPELEPPPPRGRDVPSEPPR